MIDLATDRDGDLDFTVGLFENELELAQSIRLELSTNLKEWFLDTTYGIDRNLFSDTFRPEEVNDAIADVISRENRVELDGYVTSTFDAGSRRITANFTVNVIATGEPLELEVNL